MHVNANLTLFLNYKSFHKTLPFLVYKKWVQGFELHPAQPNDEHGHGDI
jgi:hypothetical protein